MPYALSQLIRRRRREREPNKKLANILFVMMLTTIFTLTSHLSWTRAAAEDMRALEGAVTSAALEDLQSSTGLLLRSDVSFLAALSPRPPPPQPPPPMRSPPPSPGPFKSPPPIPRSSMYSPTPSPQPARLPPPPLFTPPAKKANNNDNDDNDSSKSSSPMSPTLKSSPPPSPSPSNKSTPSINSPPPSPPPPFHTNVHLFLPPPPPPPCTVCVSVTVEPMVGVVQVRTFSQADCDRVSDGIIQDMTDKASAVGAGIDQSDGPPSVNCTRRDLIQVCFKFVSNEDGNKLQGYIDDMLEDWRIRVFGGGCFGLALHLIRFWVGGDQHNAPSCLQAEGLGACAGIKYINCNTTTPGATPFGVRPRLTKLPGYSSNTVMYCFEIVQVPVVDTNTSCGRSTVLRQAKMWAHPSQANGLVGMHIKPAGAANMTAIYPKWGLKGFNDLLKIGPIRWSLKEADGGRICLELYKETNITSFCQETTPYLKQGAPTCG
ncbi:hypothetical protein Vafri_21452 [Volvox africanus]|nr:hypothetical protein Vafri_21452 [Volvox africanus]